MFLNSSEHKEIFDCDALMLTFHCLTILVSDTTGLDTFDLAFCKWRWVDYKNWAVILRRATNRHGLCIKVH